MGTTVALTQTFTTPDGTISFDYPGDWSVTALSTSTAEIPAWGVNDESGVRMFTLSIRPDGQIASPVTPQNPATVGTLPDALGAQGHPLAVGVGPFPGQSVGVNMANVYAVTSATGADRLFGYVSRGDGTMVSFEGTQEGGTNDQVDMADETQEFLQSDLFRARLLPVPESFTMKPSSRAEVAGSCPTVLPRAVTQPRAQC